MTTMKAAIIRRNLFYVSILSILLFILGCSKDYSPDVGYMPAGLCQMTCTDDATGEVYGLAVRAAAVQSDTGEGNADCFLHVDAYYGQLDNEGDFLSDPIEIRRITDGVKDYGEREGEEERYTFTMLPSGAIDESYYWGDDVLYKLLLNSTLGFRFYDSKLYAIYNHKIDNCVLNSKITVHSSCKDDGVAYVECTEYMGGAETDYHKASCDDCDHVDCGDSDDDWGDCYTDINQEDLDAILETYNIPDMTEPTSS